MKNFGKTTSAKLLATLNRNFHLLNPMSERLLLNRVHLLTWALPIPPLPTKFELGTFLQKETFFSSFVSVGYNSEGFHTSLLNQWDNVRDYYFVTGGGGARESEQIHKRRVPGNAKMIAWLKRKYGNANITEIKAKGYKTTQELGSDLSVDVVYLDEAKDYCSFMREVLTWWPVVRPNGILMGGDFAWFDGFYPGCDKEGMEYIRNLRGLSSSTELDNRTIVGGVRAALLHWAAEQDLQVVSIRWC
jgi:hypothetical protein